MPINPIDYILNVPDPLQSVLGGFEAGTAIRRQPVLEQREATEFGQQQLLFGQAQEDRAAAQAALAQQQAEAKQMQAEISDLSDNPNATAADYARIITRYPQIGTEMKQGWDILDTANKESTFRALGEVYASVLNDNLPLAESLLSDRVEALRNSGRTDEAAKTEAMLEVLRADPNAAKTSIGLALSAVNPDDFSTMFKTLEGQRRETEAEAWTDEKRVATLTAMAADLDLTQAQTNKVLVETSGLNEKAARARLEFAALEAAGGTTPEDRFDMEDKLRKQYVARIGTFPEAVTQYDKLLAASTVPNPETGAGDVALVFSFMKMLDPGSVVRESEFALAQNTGGLLTRLQNTLTKAERGEFMSPTQRKEMVALAKQFMDAAQAQADRVKADLTIPIGNYGLSAENVFGVAGQPTEPETPTPPPDVLTGAQSLMEAFR